MKASLALACIAVGLVACQTVKKEPSAPVVPSKEYSIIRVHSLPPGCWVEYNNAFIGAAPIDVTVESKDGKFLGVGPNLHIFRGFMPTNNASMRIGFHGGDKVPERIVLRMLGAETWYHALSEFPPTNKPAITFQQ